MRPLRTWFYRFLSPLIRIRLAPAAHLSFGSKLCQSCDMIRATADNYPLILARSPTNNRLKTGGLLMKAKQARIDDAKLGAITCDPFPASQKIYLSGKISSFHSSSLAPSDSDTHPTTRWRRKGCDPQSSCHRLRHQWPLHRPIDSNRHSPRLVPHPVRVDPCSWGR